MSTQTTSTSSDSFVKAERATAAAKPAPATAQGSGPRYSRSFFIAAGFLLLAAVGLQGALAAFEVVLTKQAIALRQPLQTIAENFGPLDSDFKARYEFYRDEKRLSADGEKALGTAQYLSRIYRDRSKKIDEPGGLIRVHVPYYTGTIDTVPHVPDRCFVAGGATKAAQEQRNVQLAGNPAIAVRPREDGHYTARTWMAKSVVLPDVVVPTTFVSFARPEQPDRRYHVAYFFVANSDFDARPEGVRLKAFNLTDKYAYWAKVEIMPLQGFQDRQGNWVHGPALCDVDETEKIASEFLSFALPEVMVCLPDWDQVNAEQQPADETASARSGAED